MKYYVNCEAVQDGCGDEKHPFRTISEAAERALPGDEVLVYPGIYRENVNPKHAGTEKERITYKSVEPGKAVITGAEVIKGWKKYQDNVWKVTIPNSLFGGDNPYTDLVSGDWFIAMITAHRGDVYLNGKSLYEVTELFKVLLPSKNINSWDADFTLYTWYTEQDKAKNETIIYANFQGLNPNEENVEMSVRRNCFYPLEEGIGYITLSGFKICQAATQWAPPTAYQEGMVGPHWSKGWIIEDCEICESKCSGISLGKYLQPENNNKWLHKKYKDGAQTERECICRAQREGWTKERIGSHIIRRCNIHDCGQTGIVGHLGGVFSIIEDNHIHHINNKHNLAGAEIGGIKMHAAIDVIIRRNHFHHCTRGLWLDWQAQGTRVTSNLFHDNALPFEENQTEENALNMGEDIFIEVSHGPTLVDHNLLLSECAMKLPTQGVALVHNLIAGSFTTVGRGTDNGTTGIPSPRYTPYHVPHRTEIEGFMTILHGDMRFYNNIFVQQEVSPLFKGLAELQKDNEWQDSNMVTGTIPYESYPTWEEFDAQFEGYCGMGGEPSNRYYDHLPVWAGGNVYFNGAKPMSKEKDARVSEAKVTLSIEEVDGKYVFRSNLGEVMGEMNCKLLATDDLGYAFEPEEKYENPDGSPIVFNRDFYGKDTGLTPLVGPFACVNDYK